MPDLTITKLCFASVPTLYCFKTGASREWYGTIFRLATWTYFMDSLITVVPYNMLTTNWCTITSMPRAQASSFWWLVATAPRTFNCVLNALNNSGSPRWWILPRQLVSDTSPLMRFPTAPVTKTQTARRIRDEKVPIDTETLELSFLNNGTFLFTGRPWCSGTVHLTRPIWRC